MIQPRVNFLFIDNQNLVWKRYGIFIWCFVLPLNLIFLSIVSMLLVIPLLLLRVSIICNSIRNCLMANFANKVVIYFLDLSIISLILLSKELSFKYTFTSFSAILERFLVKCFLAFLITSIFYSRAKSQYYLTFPSVPQRRWSRIRLSITQTLQRSLKTIRFFLPILFGMWIISAIIILQYPNVAQNFYLKPKHMESSNIPKNPENFNNRIPQAESLSSFSQADSIFYKIIVFINSFASFIRILISMKTSYFSFVFLLIYEIFVGIFVIEMTWNIIQIVYSEHISFEAPNYDENSHRNSIIHSSGYLIAALHDSNPFILSHALYDLYTLAFRLPLRRKMFYDINYQSWEKLVSVCCGIIDDATAVLLQVNDDFKTTSKHPAFESSDNVLKLITSNIQKKIHFIIPQRTEYDPILSLYLVVPSPSLSIQRERLILCILSLAKMLTVATKEDKIGLVASSETLPVILDSILSLLKQVEIYSRYVSKMVGSIDVLKISEPSDVHSSSSFFVYPVHTALVESIYKITTTYENLQHYTFKPYQVELLEKFLLFVK